jgi:hypothetical protein
MLSSNLHLSGPGRFGFHSRHLLRTSHRFNLQSDPLESRRLLAASPVQAAVSSGATGDIPTDTSPATASSSTVASPPAATQASPPVDNSSTTNTPGVSPMDPATPNVVTNDSPSVTTSPTADITALIPNTSPFTPSPEDPVFLVPSAVDPMTVELSVPTLNLQENTSELAFPQSGAPIILHPITSALTVQISNVAVSPQASVAPTQTQNIGQEIKTELQKPLRLELAPHPEVMLPADVFTPAPAQPSAADAPKDAKPKATKPDTDAPKIENGREEAPPAKKAPPADEALPQPPTPMPDPPDGTPLPDTEAERALVFPYRATNGTDDHTGPATFFGVVAIAGGLHLAMGEYERFGMHWLPSRVASPRSARPRVAAR